jgi:hypothetical protein
MDRRRSPRVALLVDVTVGSGANFFAGRSRDLSRGGLFIAVDPGGPPPAVALEPGAEVVVCVRIEGELFRVGCEVVWCVLDDDDRVSGAGVRFLEVSAPFALAIDGFMRRRAPIEFDVSPGGASLGE